VKRTTRRIFNREGLETTIVELGPRLLVTGYGEKVNGVFIVSSSLGGGDF
jgi:RPA family protein